LASISDSGIDVGTVVAMLIGGVIGAPVAAWLIRFLPIRALGLSVAGLLLFTNSRELATWGHLGGVRWMIYAAIIAVVIGAARFLRQPSNHDSLDREPAGVESPSMAQSAD
jgi:uncharacterized protein